MLVRASDRDVEIERLRLSPNVQKLTRGEFVHSMLTDDCRSLKLATELNVSPDGLTVVPLWEGHSYVTGYAKELHRFIKYDFYYPHVYEVLGSSINAVIADLLAWYWTEEEASDKDLRKIAELLDFPIIDEFLQQIEIANQGSAESQWEWEQRFRQSLP